MSEVAECATFISGAPPDVKWSAGRKEEEEKEKRSSVSDNVVRQV